MRKPACLKEIREHTLGEFRQENTHIFVGKMHATVVGKSLLVSVTHVRK